MSEARLARFIKGFRGRFLSPEEKLMAQRDALIRERLLDPQNGNHFKNLIESLTLDEERHYLKVLPSVIEREERLLEEYKTKVKPYGWLTTDPANHDPDNFRYIVHAIISRNDYVASLRGEAKKDYPYKDWMDLEGFLKRKLTSCTLIDEVHRGTYVQDGVPHGFILDVPEENIIAIDASDMGKPWDIQDEEAFYERERDKGIKKRQNTPSAQQFFDEGVSEWYNELVVNGIGKGGKIKVSGVFLIVDPILGIPSYELYSRTSRSVNEQLRHLKKDGYSDSLISQLPEYSSMRFYQERAQKGMQEARDLSELLSVPLIPIPQLIHPDWYRKYILSGLK